MTQINSLTHHSLERYSEGEFTVSTGGSLTSDFVIRTPLKVDPSYEDKEFEVHFLARKDVKENDVFQVFDSSRGGKRVGWCIPVNALDSIDHDYSENPHFLRYAYKGLVAAIAALGVGLYVKKGALESGAATLKLADIFHEYTCLLVISKETLDGASTFDIDRYFPSLMSYGYIPLSARNPSEMKWEGSLTATNGLKLCRVSEKLSDVQIVVSLLESALAYEARPVFRFFYVYQIIELLMDEIYKSEQTFVLAELSSKGSDVATAKDIVEQLQNLTSEKKRIGLLMDGYTDVKGELEDLRMACESFLSHVGRVAGGSTEFKDYFYGTRNYVFHQLRDLHVEKEELLSDVVNEFLVILPKLLSTYGRKVQI